jgi:hypothetical protein
MIIRTMTAVALTALACGAAQAQSASERSADQYTCKDILRESGAPREVTIAFMHGYLLGKSGTTKFNIETLLKQTDTFLDRCLDNPREKALDTLAKAVN